MKALIGSTTKIPSSNFTFQNNRGFLKTLSIFFPVPPSQVEEDRGPDLEGIGIRRKREVWLQEDLRPVATAVHPRQAHPEVRLGL